jgi:chemotaxis protein methyltransferase CheR
VTAAPRSAPRAGTVTDRLQPLTEEQFLRAREWVYRRTGMLFGDNKHYFVDKRVQACVMEHGGDFEAWFASLRLGNHARWAQELINEMTVNETYFLREESQFSDLVNVLLPQLAAERRMTRDREPIRILSLPCSTGEEPYSIALKLVAEWPDIAEFDVEIVGADINTRVLETAQRGEYGTRALHRMSRPLRTRWFETVGRERYRLKDELRGAIEFRHANICDQESMRVFRQLDFIFSRNVLIYFDQLSSRRAAENLFEALRPGGHLFIGQSESMSQVTSLFQPIRLPGGIAYQRPAIEGAL